ncbi:MAG: hypothetical protein GIW99_11200 [Candidatus Eremiobacteraeota bacterium]|nr:hypothetical protein [Candidatus Eremiobacteraeota bacterium]MBC5828226.1 hypothetical protein [Candidatus Eremiobacteraeota bacterium]
MTALLLKNALARAPRLHFAGGELVPLAAAAMPGALAETPEWTPVFGNGA